ncbi:unnamed protein product [Cercospora beticola]|nr:unnamed protein product [Cercospora beticola]
MSTSTVRTCFVCEDAEGGDQVTVVPCPCDYHHICLECLRSGIRAILADESCHPIRCGGNGCSPITIAFLLQHLLASTDPDDAILHQRLEAKLEEYSTPRPERIYCNHESCLRFYGVSQFLSPRLYTQDDRIICPHCNKPTCRLCKLHLIDRSRTHVCLTPSTDPNISADLDSIPPEDRWLTRQCLDCGVWITKESACNHMRCTCGTEFCLCCGRRWGEFWYTCQAGCPKNEAPVYDAEGFNQNGYDPATGLDRDGIHWLVHNPIISDQFEVEEQIYGADGFDEDGVDREGYDREGFDDLGFNREGRDREGYDAGGYDIHLFDRAGRDRFGIPRSWYPDHYDQGGLTFDIFGYNQEGYNRRGRDVAGRDREGYDMEGYNHDGFDQRGYNRNGLNRYGYSRHHRDPDGNIEPGFRLAPDGNVQHDHLCIGTGCCARPQVLQPNGMGCAACRLMFREGERRQGFHWDDDSVCEACTMEGAGYLSSLSAWERAGFLGLAEMIGRLELGEDYEIDATQIERRANHGW